MTTAYRNDARVIVRDDSLLTVLLKFVTLLQKRARDPEFNATPLIVNRNPDSKIRHPIEIFRLITLLRRDRFNPNPATALPDADIRTRIPIGGWNLGAGTHFSFPAGTQK